MRLLAVMASGAVGGGANHLRLLLPALAARGVDVRAAVGSDGPLRAHLERAGVAALPLELMRRRLDPIAPLRLAALVRRVDPDLIHYHGTRAAFFGALARPLVPRATVYTAHGLAYGKTQIGAGRAFFVAAERIACAGADHVISVSGPDLADLRRRGFAGAERSTHLENPVDPRHFAAGDQDLVRARLGLAPGGFVVATVARLVPQKAVGDLVAAVSLCRRPVRLVVVGDGPERAALAVAARSRRADVVFLGTRDDVADCWPAFDAFALSSRWEGEPMALLEALAAGLPCVVTDTPGSRGLLAGAPGAALVPVAEPAALAQALDALAAEPRAALRERGERNRDVVRGRGPDALAARVLALYERVLARHL